MDGRKAHRYIPRNFRSGDKKRLNTNHYKIMFGDKMKVDMHKMSHITGKNRRNVFEKRRIAPK